jgi:hypothetical protein
MIVIGRSLRKHDAVLSRSIALLIVGWKVELPVFLYISVVRIDAFVSFNACL